MLKIIQWIIALNHEPDCGGCLVNLFSSCCKLFMFPWLQGSNAKYRKVFFSIKFLKCIFHLSAAAVRDQRQSLIIRADFDDLVHYLCSSAPPVNPLVASVTIIRCVWTTGWPQNAWCRIISLSLCAFFLLLCPPISSALCYKVQL